MEAGVETGLELRCWSKHFFSALRIAEFFCFFFITVWCRDLQPVGHLGLNAHSGDCFSV